MPEIVIKPGDFESWLRKQLVQDTEIVRKAGLEAVQWGLGRAVKVTDEVGAVDQNLFKQSWVATSITNGAELRNDAPYAGIIERGRRPGRPGPPLAPILAWAKRKLGGEIKGNYRFAKRLALGLAGAKGTRKARADARRDVRSAFGTDAEGTAKGIYAAAVAIRRSIHVRGIKPKWILRRTFAEMKPRFKNEALRRLRSNKR